MSEPSWAQAVSKTDVYLFHEGTLYQSYRTFGAHLTEENGRPAFVLPYGLPMHAKSPSFRIGTDGEETAMYYIRYPIREFGLVFSGNR
ncbi:hypothetical protein HMSSN036_16120 [Paenibacillus macerans]|nr:hypothetical protein HMSSN036_16120 [Paenibacillus macerans]